MNEILERFDALESKMSSIIDDRIDRLQQNLSSMIDEKINKKFVEIQTRMEDLLDVKVKNLEKQMTKKLEVVDDMSKKIESRESIEKLVKVTFSDFELKQERRPNFVVFNAPECKGNLKSETEKNDKGTIMEILNVCQVSDKFEESDIKKVIRLGKKGDKPRPILVKCSHEELKKPLFSNLNKLRESESLKHLKIQHDMSRQERQEEKERVEKVKELNNNSGNLKFKIRGPPWDRRVIKLS